MFPSDWTKSLAQLDLSGINPEDRFAIDYWHKIWFYGFLVMHIILFCLVLITSCFKKHRLPLLDSDLHL